MAKSTPSLRAFGETKSMTTQIDPTSSAIPSAGVPLGDNNVVVRGRLPYLFSSITALVWLIPMLLLAVAALQTWRMEINDASGDVQNILTVLTEQTEQVFQSHTMALAWIDKRTKGWTWDDIERSAELHDFIADLNRGPGYIDSVFLADRTGRIRMTAHHFPLGHSPVFVGDRDYFTAAEDGASDLIYIGRLQPGKSSGKWAFRVARRRSAADGGFDGIIAVTMGQKYFDDFFERLVKDTPSAITISRADGIILARNPSVPHGTPNPDDQPYSDLITFRSTEPTIFTSTLDGVERLGAVRRLRNYPIFVTYAIDMQSIRKQWMDRLRPFAIVAFSSSLILALLSLYVHRIARGERIAQEALQQEVKDRLQRDAQFRQALKMEALGRLAGGVAHHFNNLLPAISGHLDMIRADVPANSSAVKRLERIISAVDQGRDLVRQILTFSHPNVARRDRVLVSTIIHDAIALAQGNLPENISLLLSQKYDGVLLGDAAQLRDVLLNLISNAIHAIGPRSGTITISTEIFLIDVETARRLAIGAGWFVRIECSDNGIGMSEDVQEHAFEPFFTTKPIDQGSGLGLAIVHGSVVGHNGAVEVHSSPGVGSRFSVYLPAVRSV